MSSNDEQGVEGVQQGAEPHGLQHPPPPPPYPGNYADPNQVFGQANANTQYGLEYRQDSSHDPFTHDRAPLIGQAQARPQYVPPYSEGYKPVPDQYHASPGTPQYAPANSQANHGYPGVNQASAPIMGSSPGNPNYGAVYGQTIPVVTTQPQPTYVVQDRAMVKQYEQYMVWSILVCLCCCWPIGICAILQSSEAKSAALAGNRMKADHHARSAKNLIIASFVGGLITVGAVIAVVVIRMNQLQDCYNGDYNC